MSQLSFAIVTPSFNQAPFIEATLRSVLEQRYPVLDYLVMDGGSTDGTVDILRRYSDKVRWVSEKDGGQSAAICEGFKRTTGEICAWINSDDVYTPGAFEAVARAFERDPSVQWVAGRCDMIDELGRPKRALITRYKDYFLNRYSYSRLLVENFISQPAVFFRRSLFDAVGGLDFDYHYAMDYHLWLRMGERHDPYVLDQVLASFRVYRTTKTSSRFDRTFSEELEAAERVSRGRHPVLMARHRLNRLKLMTAYNVMSRLGV